MKSGTPVNENISISNNHFIKVKEAPLKKAQ
jgi:hypothetical protein